MDLDLVDVIVNMQRKKSPDSDDQNSPDADDKETVLDQVIGLKLNDWIILDRFQVFGFSLHLKISLNVLLTQ